MRGGGGAECGEQTLKLKLERSCSCPPTGAADLVPSQAFYLLGWAAFLLPRAPR